MSLGLRGRVADGRHPRMSWDIYGRKGQMSMGLSGRVADGRHPRMS